MPKIKKLFSLIKNLAASGLLIVCGVFGYAGITYLIGGSLIPAPDYAIVYIDMANKTYIAPPCLDKRNPNALVKSRLKEAYKLENFNADGDCVEQGVFFEDDRSIVTKLLEKAGFISPHQSRWNNDGTWNW